MAEETGRGMAILSLFNDDFTYNQEANRLHETTRLNLEQVFKSYLKDFSPREIAHVMQQCIMEMELESIISRQAIEANKNRKGPPCI